MSDVLVQRPRETFAPGILNIQFGFKRELLLLRPSLRQDLSIIMPRKKFRQSGVAIAFADAYSFRELALYFLI